MNTPTVEAMLSIILERIKASGVTPWCVQVEVKSFGRLVANVHVNSVDDLRTLFPGQTAMSRAYATVVECDGICWSAPAIDRPKHMEVVL